MNRNGTAERRDERAQNTLKALIFDFDGLIVDTEVPEFRAWQEVYHAHGCRLSLRTWSVCIGTSEPVFDPWQHLQMQLGRSLDRAQLFAQHERLFVARVKAQKALSGVRQTLASAREAGWKIGLASSSKRVWVVENLERLELLSFFDDLKTRDDVSRTKPDPELYQVSLRALGVEPGEAIALEDSPNGVRAAQSAGMFCVAVPNALTRRLSLDEADWQIASMSELSLPELIQRHAATYRVAL